jgi:ferritin-like metal-binding protein YciE
MAQTARDIFVIGLRNAHAMEIQARELMERQSERLDDYPEVKSRVTSHLSETNEQLWRLEQCLEAYGESSSALKDTAQSLMANMTAIGHLMTDDEILKNTFANDAFEHYEIAAYKSLLTLCHAAAVDSARPLLEAVCRDPAAAGGLSRANCSFSGTGHVLRSGPRNEASRQPGRLSAIGVVLDLGTTERC